MMKVVDIKACSELVHNHNKDIVVVVDNTFMSAYFQVRAADVCFTLFWFCNGRLIVSCYQIPVHVETSHWLTLAFGLYVLSAPWLWELMSACIQPPNTWTVGYQHFSILQFTNIRWKYIRVVGTLLGMAGENSFCPLTWGMKRVCNSYQQAPHYQKFRTLKLLDLIFPNIFIKQLSGKAKSQWQCFIPAF